MAQTVNVNIPSLNAQRNLNRTQSQLATALQRLSSGLRINSARDDAAGLSIAVRFTSQIRGANQAARNASDGISLAQTAEGALSEIVNNLQRIRELAVQSANSTNSATDRASLNAEASQLIAEIDRVSTQTTFNGVVLLDGTFTAQTFQVGADAGNTITITSIASSRTAALGVGSGSSYATDITSGALTTTAISAGDVVLNNYQVGATSTDGVSYSYGDGSAIAKVAAINAVSGSTNVTATVSATSVTGGAVTSSAIGGDTTDFITINGVTLGAIAAVTDDAAGDIQKGNQIAAAINAVTAQTGVTATSDAVDGELTLTAADGRNIIIDVGGTGSSSGLADGNNIATYELSSTDSAGINISGVAAGLTAAGLTAGLTAATTTVGAGVSSLDLTTASGSTSALAVIDAALATVTSSQGDLGSYQARFASTVVTLQTTAENLSASRSRIQDADFAAETANLSRALILQQAGLSILAQANALPQNVLALLQ